jgi:hypothetical protein
MASPCQCRLSRHCRWQGVLPRALQAYLPELDGVTLADLAEPVPSAPAAALRSYRHTQRKWFTGC